jgi:tetratricopeptide (TPR) repeat protein
LNRDKDAIKLYENFVKTHPKSEIIYYALGVSYYTVKEEDKSVLTMKKVLEINPNNADALNFIGYTYAEKGQNLDEAERLVKRALEISPNKGYIVDSLGWIYYKRGNLDKAIELLEKAAQLSGDDPSIIEHIGDVYNDKGDELRALSYYEKGLKMDEKEQDDKELKTRLEKKINTIRGKLGAQGKKGEI